jgi:DNA repair protein RadC
MRRRIKELPAEMRPRERLLLQGPEALSNTELLALFLRTGRRDGSALEVAEELLAQHGGLAGLRNAGIAELCAIKGIGKAKAIEIRAAFELAARLKSLPGRQGTPVRTAADVWESLGPRLRGQAQECLQILLLDGKHREIATVTVSLGTADGASTHPRDVFREAVKRNAVAGILVHNHPSGDPTPSAEDLQVTREMVEAGRLLGIEILDHVIIGEGRYCSIKKERLVSF